MWFLLNAPTSSSTRRVALARGSLGSASSSRDPEPRLRFSQSLCLCRAVRESLALDPVGRRGRELKEHEDVLDSILCAYLAFHLWRWGWQQNEMLCDLESGYIVIPRRHTN